MTEIDNRSLKVEVQGPVKACPLLILSFEGNHSFIHSFMELSPY
jgi:hypothetical protein